MFGTVRAVAVEPCEGYLHTVVLSLSAHTFQREASFTDTAVCLAAGIVSVPPAPPQTTRAQVYVGEPTVPDTISILRGLKEKYEDHHGVHITDRCARVYTCVCVRSLSVSLNPTSA